MEKPTSINDIKVKKWYSISPTIIGSDYNRYEIISVDGDSFIAHVKSPCIGMEGCDRCNGPHRIKNRFCSKTIGQVSNIPQPSSSSGGIYLFFLDIGSRINGIWQAIEWKQKPGCRSGLAHFKRVA